MRTGIDIKDQEIDHGKQKSAIKHQPKKFTYKKPDIEDPYYFDLNQRPGKIEKPPLPIEKENDFLVIDRDEYMKERKIFSFPN